MNIAPIIAGKQNQILRRFRAANATSADSARSAQEVGCRESLVFRGLLARGVLVEASSNTGSPGRYYLDAEAADNFVANRRKLVFSALLIAIVVVVVILLTR